MEKKGLKHATEDLGWTQTPNNFTHVQHLM